MTQVVFSADEYHAGPDDTPRLSASIATILCTRTPLHAWTAHPKLNPYYERVEEDKFDVGKAAHSVILEGDDCIYVVHEDSWRKDVAKEAREYARSIGKVPLLAAKRDEVMRMVDAVRTQLEDHDAEPPLFSDGKPEATLLWDEDGAALKARLDWLRDDCTTIDDLKTTGRSADPDAYARNLFSVGGDVQAAFYRRAVLATTGEEPRFRWVVVETSPPFALSVITPSSEMLALGEAKVEWAIQRWRLCMSTGRWAGYGADVHVAEVPGWEEGKWLERKAREAVAA
jgi:PDDEXK-like uncharacterized protein DUF3799